MASLLKAVKPKEAKQTRPKVVIFGKAGVGKTWGALDFPNVYYIDSEGGATEKEYIEKLNQSNGVYFGKEHGSQSFETVIEQLKGLATEKHEYKTVIIDSFTKLFDIEVANEVERLTASKTAIAYGIERKSAVKLTKRLIGWLDKLDMTAILICHSKNEYVKGEAIGFTFDGYDKLEYELQLCLEITKQGNSRKAFVRKTRIAGFPDATTFDWNYKKFAEMFGGEDKLNKSAIPIEMATSEQINEFRNLLSLIKLGDTPAEKRLMEINENIEEETKETAEKALKYLKDKINLDKKDK